MTVSGAAALPDGVTLRSGFTGKEDQAPDFGIGYTDFGARLYSPASRRWMVPDPLSEKYYGISPYAYCAGNPVSFVDPAGQDIYEFNRNGTYYVTETDDPYDTLIWSDSGRSVIIKDRSIMNNLTTGYYPYRFSDDSPVVQRSMIYSVFPSDSPDKNNVFRFLTQKGCPCDC